MPHAAFGQHAGGIGRPQRHPQRPGEVVAPADRDDAQHSAGPGHSRRERAHHPVTAERDRDISPACGGHGQFPGVLKAGRGAHLVRDTGVFQHPADRRQQPWRPAAARRWVYHEAAAAGHGTSGR